MMNNSGVAVASLVKQLDDITEQLIILHDEVDLPLGEMRLSKDSGSAGHKGVNSIISSIGSKGFNRVRIGVHPEEGKSEDTESYVLKKLSPDQQELLKETIVSNLSLIESLGK